MCVCDSITTQVDRDSVLVNRDRWIDTHKQIHNPTAMSAVVPQEDVQPKRPP
jgi:hypothetical protein